MDQLLEQLKSIKKIRPDSDYSKISRQIILNTSQTPLNQGFYLNKLKLQFFQSLNFSAALGLVAVLIYILGVSLNPSSTTLAQKNQKPTPQDFNIHLENARYYKEIAPNVFVVVLEDSKTLPKSNE